MALVASRGAAMVSGAGVVTRVAAVPGGLVGDGVRVAGFVVVVCASLVALVGAVSGGRVITGGGFIAGGVALLIVVVVFVDLLLVIAQRGISRGDIDFLAVLGPGGADVEHGVDLVRPGHHAEPSAALVEVVVVPAQAAVDDGERGRDGALARGRFQGLVQDVAVCRDEFVAAGELAVRELEERRAVAPAVDGPSAGADEVVVRRRGDAALDLVDVADAVSAVLGVACVDDG